MRARQKNQQYDFFTTSGYPLKVVESRLYFLLYILYAYYAATLFVYIYTI